MEELLQQLQLLQKRVEELEARSHQGDILPDVVKSRHIGEGVRFIRADVAANRPTSGEKDGAIYFATDTYVLSVWSASAAAWKSTTLS